MKIASGLRRLYEDELDVNEELLRRVTRIVGAFKNPRWHYEGRTKSEESFAVKVESGAVADPGALEDFTACTLVVPNLRDITSAEELACGAFELVERRPKSARIPQNSPESFLFDDIRLYMKIKSDDALPPERSDGIVFELQIKTFLDHAWSVATHDTIYKARSLSWPRERIAHQVKAMLEHAEVTIDNVAVLESAAGLPAEWPKYMELTALINLFVREWDDDALPQDLKRLASSVLKICKSVGIASAEDVATLLANGRSRYGGRHNADWSPYRAVTEYLVDERGEKLRKLICSGGGRSTFLHEETVRRLEVPRNRQVLAVVL